MRKDKKSFRPVKFVRKKIHDEDKMAKRKLQVFVIILLLLLICGGVGGCSWWMWGSNTELKANQTVLTNKGKDEQEIPEFIKLEFNKSVELGNIKYKIDCNFEPEKDWSTTLSGNNKEFFVSVIIPRFSSALPIKGKEVELHETIFIGENILIEEKIVFDV